MRASRLVSILMILQARGRTTADQLAEELEVSTRTIYRDVEALQFAGVPLYGSAGHDGGFELLGGYRTRLDGLTTEEAGAIFLAGLPGPAAELGLESVVATLQLKLLAAMPVSQRQRAGELSRRFHFDAPSWFSEGDESPHLGAVANAVRNQQCIVVRYRSWENESTRTLEPYGLVLKGGRWYVAANTIDPLPAEGAAVRTYRVNQILAVSSSGDTFDIPSTFDLGAYWRASVVGFRAGRIGGEATIKVSLRGQQLLRELEAEPAATALDSALRRDDDPGAGHAGTASNGGWRVITVPIESVEHAHTQFLSLGNNVEVLAPFELRQRLARTAADLTAIYSEC